MDCDGSYHERSTCLVERRQRHLRRQRCGWLLVAAAAHARSASGRNMGFLGRTQASITTPATRKALHAACTAHGDPARAVSFHCVLLGRSQSLTCSSGIYSGHSGHMDGGLVHTELRSPS